MALTTGFTEVLVHIVRVGHSTDRCKATIHNHAQLTRRELDLSVPVTTANQLSICASRTSHLGALLRLHLDIVDDGTHRNVFQRQAIAWLDVSRRRRNDLVTNTKTLRR